MKVTLLNGTYDNYVFVIHGPNKHFAVIDPSAADIVDDFIQAQNGQLDYILNTHHHGDHIGGNADLVKKYGCKVIGPIYEQKRIPNMDATYCDNDVFDIWQHPVNVMFLPGHTLGHVAYYMPDCDMLFSGDVLFSMGCGRMFEGTPNQFWNSLKRLRALPAQTKIYCAHEYTVANGHFALSLEPDNVDIVNAMEHAVKMREAGKRTVPTTMGHEQKINPFLRVDQDDFLQAVDMQGQDAIAVFAKIRAAKDHF